MNDIVKLAIDSYRGKAAGNFTQADNMKALREALIDANGGSTKMDFKRIRDGKCSGLFTIIEETLRVTTEDGIKGDEMFMNLVDYRNIGNGDENRFFIPDNSYFVVSEIAEGSQSMRRQRLNGGTEITVPLHVYGLKIYEELNRVLAGRVDFNEMIDRANASYLQKTRMEIFEVWNGLTQASLGGTTYYPAAGTYDEDTLLDLIAHVEAATGKQAIIYGTKKALRNLKMTELSNDAKNDLYNIGYVGKFYGTPVVSMRQIHKLGTNDFLLDDDKIYIMAAEDKPIKYVTAGDPTIIMGDPTTKADFTQEFTYIDTHGVVFALSDKFGIYEMSA